MQTTDFLIIGGGVVGLSLARELRRKHPDARVDLLEKEPALGLHASGRNSGVLHAGFYYTADTLKARFTVAGNRALRDYCLERGIALNACGKLVVAQNEHEHGVLDELLARGERNGVDLKRITAQEAREIEPRVRTYQHALWSPTTSSVDPAAVMAAMERDAVAEGVGIHCGEGYKARLGSNGGDSATTVRTNRGDWQAGYVVNAAGLYADRIARDFGFGEAYRILPFKGLYLYSGEPVGAIHTHIYPVPDLRNPFLGVHFTLTVDGHAKIGPTAIPAFWREQYSGLSNFSAGEMAEIVLRQLGLFFGAGFDFRSLAAQELRKYIRGHLVGLSTALMEGVHPADYRRWGKPGIRAQLLNIREKKLEMDFVFEHDARSLHVLNAVSPGFTCALPFAQHLCENIG